MISFDVYKYYSRFAYNYILFLGLADVNEPWTVVIAYYFKTAFRFQLGYRCLYDPTRPRCSNNMRLAHIP